MFKEINDDLWISKVQILIYIVLKDKWIDLIWYDGKASHMAIGDIVACTNKDLTGSCLLQRHPFTQIQGKAYSEYLFVFTKIWMHLFTLMYLCILNFFTNWGSYKYNSRVIFALDENIDFWWKLKGTLVKWWWPEWWKTLKWLDWWFYHRCQNTTIFATGEILILLIEIGHLKEWIGFEIGRNRPWKVWIYN